MTKLAEFRKQYPEYDNVDDKTLADGLHKKFYSSVPKDEYYKKIGLDNSDAAVVEEASIGGELAKGLARGKDQLDSLIGTATKSIGIEVHDRLQGRYGDPLKPYAKAVENYGRQVERENMEEALANQAAVPSFTDIGSVSDALKYGAAAVGEGIPMLAAPVVGGVAGGLMGGQKGAVAGIVAPGFGLNTAEVIQGLEEKGIDDRGLAALVGVPLTALDSLTPASIISKLTGRGLSQAAAEGILKRVGRGTASGFGKEAATEAAQETIQTAAINARAGEDILTGEDAINILDAGIKGGLTGGLVEGAVSAIPPRAGQTPPPPPSNPSPVVPPVPTGAGVPPVAPTQPQPASVQQPVAPPASSPVAPPAAPGPALSPDTVPRENLPPPPPASQPASGQVDIIDPESGETLARTTGQMVETEDGPRFVSDVELGNLGGKILDPEDFIFRPVDNAPAPGVSTPPDVGGRLNDEPASEPSPVPSPASAIPLPQETGGTGPIPPGPTDAAFESQVQGGGQGVPSPIAPDTVPTEGLPTSVPSVVKPDSVPQEGLPAVDPNPFPPSPVSPDTVPQENLPRSVPSVVKPDTVPQEGLPQEEDFVSPFKRMRSAIRDDILVKGMTAQELRQLAERELKEPVPVNSVKAKYVEEQAEAAVSELADGFAQLTPDPKTAFDDIVELYNRQPKLATRTGDSARRQAFSTPAPLGFVAAKLAGIDRTKTVYEPTAGTGMLLQGSDPKKVFANEIDRNRANILRDRGFNVTEGDALRNEDKTPVDVVVTNPPFGMIYDGEGKNIVNRVKLRDGKEFATTDVGHAIALDALNRMKPDGRAVVIVGSKYDPRLEKASDEVRDKARADRYKVGNTRLFYKNLFKDYNVTDHFTVAGDLYAKQGTVFPVDVIVINGTRTPKSDTDFSRPLPAVNLPRVMTTWDQLKGLIDGTPVDGMGTTGNKPSGVGTAPAEEAGQNDTDRVPVPPKDQQSVSGSDGGSTGTADADGVSKPDEAAAKPPRRSGGTRGSSGGKTRTVRPDNGGDGGSVPAPADGRPDAPGDTGSGEAGGRSVRNGRGGGDDPDLSSMFDDVLDEVAPSKDKKPATKASVPSPAPSKAPAQAKERGVGEAATSAAKNASQAALDALDGLAALLGKAPGRLGSGLNFDAETYAAAKPLFKSALENIQRTGTDLRDMMKAIVRFLHDVKGVERDVLKEKFQPLVVKFMEEVRDGTIVVNDPPADAPTMEQLIEAASIEKVPEQTTPTPTPKKEVQQDAETEFQVAYKPKSKANSVGSLAPKRMQDALDNALQKIEDDFGSIDQYVAEKLNYPVESIGRYFSAEQVDALALAIDNVDRGRGFIIGDQTGVGKGRFVAAMLRYAKITGKIPVFVTQKPGLYKDMIRDLTDIGMADAKSTILTTNRRGSDRGVVIDPDTGEMLEFRTNNEQNRLEQYMKDNGKLPEGYDMLFTTYDQMNYKKAGRLDKGEVKPGEKYLRQEALEAIAPRAMLVLDESHSAGGSPGNDPRLDNRDTFFRNIVRGSAGSVFSSATYAKNPHNMTLYASTDMALAVENPEKLAAAIEAGGVPLQQVVSRGLVQAGQMVRRERSWDGIEVRTQRSAVDKNIAADFSGLLQEAFYLDYRFKDVKEAFGSQILPNLGRQLGRDPALNTMQVGFTNIMHNLIGQALLAIKAQAVAEYALEQHKNGQKVIVTVSSTMEGALAEIMESKGIKPGQDITGKISFNDIFEKYMGRMRTAIVRNDEKPEEPHRIYIDDDMMREMGYDELLTEFNEVIKKVRNADLKGLPISPIDDIKSRMKAGGMTVGEITGRSVEVVKGRTVSREKGINAKVAAMNGFNTGKLDALVINRSGATGFSLHASERPEVTDKRVRHMIVAQPEADVNDFMQMLGRINRTGQVVKPIYSLFFSDLPAERRPTAQLLKKLASLNANTSANAEGNFGVADGADFQNKYGGEVVGQLLRDEPDIAAKLEIRIPGDNQKGDEALLNRFMGRAQILDPAEQERLFDMLVENYNSLIENLNATGQNTLEAKEMDVDGKVISSVELEPPKGTSGSPFEEAATFELIDMKRLTKPLKMEQVQEKVKESLGLDPKTPTDEFQFERGLRISAMRDELNEGWTTSALDIMQRIRAAEEDLQAEQGKATEEKPNTRKIDAAAQKLDGLNQLQEATNRNKEYLDQKLTEVTFGKTVRIESGTGENVSVQYGVVTNVENKKTAKNPMALSNYVWTVYTSRDSTPMKITASQMQSGAIVLGPESASVVIPDFAKNFNEGREKRGVITGNILAGYAKLGNKGTITAIRMSDGTLKDAVLMPPNFNLEKELAKLPVEIDDPKKIAQFVSEQALTRHVRSPGGQNEGVHVNMQRSGQFYVLIKTGSRRDRPLYTSQKVDDYLTFKNIAGGGGFVKRSEGYSVRIPDREVLEGLLKIYMEDYGVQFVAPVDTARAREIMGQAPIEAKGFEFRRGLKPVPGVKDAVRQAWLEMNLPITQVMVKDTIRVSDRDIEALEKSLGRRAKPEERQVQGGVFEDGTAGLMAVIAMDAHDPRSTAFHEAFHILQRQALTPSEKKILQQATPRLKQLAANNIGVMPNDKIIDGLSREELEAYAFQQYMKIRDMGINPGPIAGPIHPVFAKLYEFFRRLRNLLAGYGFKSPNDIFTEAASGKLGERVPDPTPQTLETFRRLADPVYFSFYPPKNPNRTPQVQRLIDKTMGDSQGQNILHQSQQAFQTYQTWGQRLEKIIFERMFGMGFREAVVDSFDPIRKMEEAQYGNVMSAENSPWKTARLTRNLGSVMAMVFNHGPIELANGMFRIKGHAPGQQVPDRGLRWVFEDIAREGKLDEWKLYRVGKRAARLKADAIAQGKKRTDFLPPGVDENDLIALKTPQDAALFDEADRRFDQFNSDMLDMAVQAGILSQASKRMFLQTQDYIPFYRILEASDGRGNPMTRGGIADQRGPFIRIKGSDKVIQDPYFNIVNNYVKLVDASYKNRAMYMTKDLAVQTGAMRKLGKAYKNANVPMWIDKNRNELARIGFDWNSVPPQTQREIINLISLTAPTGPDVVSVMVNGKPQYYEVLDPALLRALKGLNPNGFNALIRFLGGAKNILTRAVTSLPTFLLRNSIRDTMSVWVTGNVKGFRPFIGAASGFVKGLRETETLQTIAAAGGGTGAFYGLSPEDMARQIYAMSDRGTTKALHMPRRIWDAYSKLGRASEVANRVEVFEKLTAQGVHPAEAAFQAMDVMDFSSRGANGVIRTLTEITPFLNARIQGLDRLARGAIDNPTRFATRGLILMALSLAVLAMFQDDDRYKELEDWNKDLNYHFWIGDQHFQIPKPFEVGLLFSTIPERAMKAASGTEGWDDFTWSVLKGIGQTLAFNPFTSNPIFNVPLEQYSNTVSFTGRPIVTLGMDRLEPERRSNSYTTNTAQIIADWMPDFMPETLRSPVNVESIARGTFGTLGLWAMKVTDDVFSLATDNPKPKEGSFGNVPILGVAVNDIQRAFFPEDKNRVSKYVTEFYEMSQKIDRAVASINDAKSDGDDDGLEALEEKYGDILSIKKFVSKTKKQMTDLNKESVQVRNDPNLSAEEKKKQLDIINQYIKDLAQDVMMEVEAMGLD